MPGWVGGWGLTTAPMGFGSLLLRVVLVLSHLRVPAPPLAAAAPPSGEALLQRRGGSQLRAFHGNPADGAPLPPAGDAAHGCMVE